jgi:hypothetical protein
MHRERMQSFMFMYLLYRTSEVEVGLWVEPFKIKSSRRVSRIWDLN